MWDVLAGRIEGTAGNPSKAMLESCGIDPNTDIDEIDFQLSNQGVEMCPGCGWWYESIELDNDSYCFDCLEDDEVGK